MFQAISDDNQKDFRVTSGFVGSDIHADHREVADTNDDDDDDKWLAEMNDDGEANCGLSVH